MGETFNKICLLLWKNWTIQKRKKLELAVDVMIPIFIGALLLYIRYSAKVYDHPEATTFEPFPTNFVPVFPSPVASRSVDMWKWIAAFNARDLHGLSLPSPLLSPKNPYRGGYSLNDVTGFTSPPLPKRGIVIWSPDSPVANSIMEAACKKMNVVGRGVKDAETLEKTMTISSDQFPRPRDMILAGIAFPDNLTEDHSESVNVRIRFPGESRFQPTNLNSMIPRHWLTGLIFPLFQVPGPRDAMDNEGGAPGYYREGFLGVQDAISSSFLEYHMKEQRAPKVEIKLQRFPYPEYIIDPLLLVMQNILPFLIVLSFLFSVKNLVEKITSEKERRLEVVMDIMGLSKTIRWSSWFIYSLLFFIFLISILVVTFKVPFIHGRAVFPHSDWSCLVLFFIVYAFAGISFCFLMSTLFTRATTASMVAGMVWFLIFVPFYIIQPKYAEFDTLTKSISSLFLNTGMGIGFQIILMHEGAGNGLQWNNLTTPASPDDGMTMALLLGILIIDCIIYWCVALYIENVMPGEYGTPLPWYYPLQRTYWVRSEPAALDESEGDEKADYPIEAEPKNLTAGIRMKNLRKVYGDAKKAAVKNLTLNVYEEQITVLMGFNGAGKTTTMSILTGIYPPTSGSAMVAGLDVKTDMKEVRKRLGFCPQHNVLFDELTVEDHIRFFGKIKGLNEAELKKENEKYINLLNLDNKRTTMAKFLSGGMKRKLSVALAMCGNTKVLLLDEPTAGMDPSARRSLWDLLISEKKGRTVLITTHHLDEADLLGDRVAIMSEGKLKCCGTTFFLKKQFSCGYRLIIVKKDNCDVERITSLVRSHVPEVLHAEVVSMELSYQLPEKYSNQFGELFRAIESDMEELGITSYGVSPSSLEDVFMRVAASTDEENQASRKVDENLNRGPVDHVQVNVSSNSKLTGYQLVLNQISAMFYKNILYSVRSWKTNVLLILIAISGVGTAIFTIRVNGQLLALPPRDLELRDFPEGIISIGVGSGCVGFCESLFKSYANVIGKQNVQVVTLNETKDMDGHLLSESKKSIYAYRNKHILGTTFDMKNEERVDVTGWFNAQPYHVPPIALSNIYNSIVQAMLGSKASITFTNEPLPFREESKISIQGSGLDSGFQIAVFIAFTYVFIVASFISFPVQERQVKAKLLQFVSGVNCFTFWSVAFLWSLLMTVGPNLALIATLAAFGEEGFSTAEELGNCAAVIFSVFVAALPLTYLVSLIFSKPSLAFTLYSFFNIISGIHTTIIVVVLRIPILDLADVADALDWIFPVFPLYSLSRSIQNVKTSTVRLKMCKPIYEQLCVPNEKFMHVCCKVPDQCPGGVCLKWSESVWDWDEPGFGRYIATMYLTGLVTFTLLIIVDSGIFNFLKFRRRVRVEDSQNVGRDSDVLAEREKVLSMQSEDKSNFGLLVEGMSKSFKGKAAVSNVYLAVTQGECFGLLGANGAGKTTTFRMLTGDEIPSSGNAYVKGYSLRNEMEKVHQLIGYCPQFDALFDELTGREHLQLYCLIRGVPKEEVEEISIKLAQELLFEEFLDRRVGQYSGGNKRKLSTALSLIGNPLVVYLDEPTAGIDPVAKRHLWDVISKIRAQGTTIILTSHSMEECEALCTRLTVMVKGEFKCLGTTQYLKNKFCQGYSLAIKIRKRKFDSNGQESNPLEEEKMCETYVAKVKQFVASNFSGAVQTEEHEELLVFRIPFSDMTWSKMFDLIESVKEELNIEDYSLGQTTLEQIVLMFTGVEIE